jgi:hypothetical protein
MTRIAHALSVIASSSLLLLAQKLYIAPDETDRDGQLVVQVVDAFGNLLHDKLSISLALFDRRDQTLKLVGGRPVAVKYGRYRLTVTSPGAYPVERTITVSKPNQIVSVCMFLAPIELPWDGNLVRGSLSVPNARKCPWVRLSSLFADDETHNSEVSMTGGFAFDDVRPGKYLLVAVGEFGVCGTSIVTIKDQPVQEIATSDLTPLK